jgi:GNAT superfamily N-acetyltransferase
MQRPAMARAGDIPETVDLERFDRAERAEVHALVSMWEGAPAAVREELGLGRARVEGAFVGWAPRLDVPMYNRAFRLGLERPLTEEALDAVLAPLIAARAPRAFVQVVPGARPAEAIPLWLEARGLRRYNRWMRLVRDPREPAAAALAVAHWRVEEIGRERALDFGRVNATAFGEPPPLEAWSAAMVGRPGWSAYLAYDGETPIACAGIHIQGDLAWMGMAGTLEAYRGKGAQSALIARRLADAAARGVTLVSLETAEDRPEKPAPSFRNQLRFGFRLLYARENWLLAS